MFLIENEYKAPFLTFISCQKYFYDIMDLRLFYFHVRKYSLLNLPSFSSTLTDSHHTLNLYHPI